MQAQDVSGTVSDANGPLPGASVVVKGTTTGTQTDFDGNYTLSGVPSDGVLVFSYIGYKKEIIQNIEVGSSLRLNMELEPMTLDLEEVVVLDKKMDYNVKSMELGVNEFTPKVVESVPILFGERDIIKTIQLLAMLKQMMNYVLNFFFLLPSYITYLTKRDSSLALNSCIFLEGRKPTCFKASRFEVINQASVPG